jgi:hypothetical protein
MRLVAATIALICGCSAVEAQTLSNQALVEGRGIWFGEQAPNDPTRGIIDVIARDDMTVTPARWLQLSGGVELRANSHDQVEEDWRFDVEDRSVLRPRLSLRRLSATFSQRRFSVDVGKQFVRWARADVVNPIDRFAPRDYLEVIDSEFLGILAVRPAIEVGSETLEAIWTPQMTPSRMPLLDQRWTVVPPEAAGFTLVDQGARFPERAQFGARWRHTGSRLEAGLAYFDGFNHLPNIEATPIAADAIGITRVFPRLRMYGGDFAIPTKWFTFKGEAGYFVSPDDRFSSYGLYVVELERQAGEWFLTGGYAGEVHGEGEPPLAFDPERGLARTLIGRASYTVDPRRTVTIEGAVRQTADGVYVKGEYSQAIAQYWRLTFTGVAIGGEPDDFLGQFQHNSHVSAGLRFTF